MDGWVYILNILYQTAHLYTSSIRKYLKSESMSPGERLSSERRKSSQYIRTSPYDFKLKCIIFNRHTHNIMCIYVFIYMYIYSLCGFEIIKLCILRCRVMCVYVCASLCGFKYLIVWLRRLCAKMSLHMPHNKYIIRRWLPLACPGRFQRQSVFFAVGIFGRRLQSDS